MGSTNVFFLQTLKVDKLLQTEYPTTTTTIIIIITKITTTTTKTTFTRTWSMEIQFTELIWISKVYDAMPFAMFADN